MLKMPVTRLLDEMTYEEFHGWLDYFNQRPYEWRSDDRAYKLMQTWGAKEKASKVFPSLEPIYNRSRGFNEEGTDMSTLKGSYLFKKMMGAKGGDQVDL